MPNLIDSRFETGPLEKLTTRDNYDVRSRDPANAGGTDAALDVVLPQVTAAAAPAQVADISRQLENAMVTTQRVNDMIQTIGTDVSNLGDDIVDRVRDRLSSLKNNLDNVVSTVNGHVQNLKGTVSREAQALRDLMTDFTGELDRYLVADEGAKTALQGVVAEEAAKISDVSMLEDLFNRQPTEAQRKYLATVVMPTALQQSDPAVLAVLRPHLYGRQLHDSFPDALPTFLSRYRAPLTKDESERTATAQQLKDTIEWLGEGRLTDQRNQQTVNRLDPWQPTSNGAMKIMETDEVFDEYLLNTTVAKAHKNENISTLLERDFPILSLTKTS